MSEEKRINLKFWSVVGSVAIVWMITSVVFYFLDLDTASQQLVLLEGKIKEVEMENFNGTGIAETLKTLLTEVEILQSEVEGLRDQLGLTSREYRMRSKP